MFSRADEVHVLLLSEATRIRLEEGKWKSYSLVSAIRSPIVAGRSEDDGNSAWLYLSDSDTARVVAVAWAYNRVPPPPMTQLESFRPGPPPAAEGFAGPEALCADPSAHRWSLQWSADGDSVAVLRDGVAHGREMAVLICL